jgi:hypothetical protein
MHVDPSVERDAGTRWRFYDAALLWLFPCTYLVHLLEEWFVSTPLLTWHARLDHQQWTAGFLIANAIGFALMVTGVTLAIGRARFHWIVPALAVATLLNTTGHLVGSVAAGSYSAGLVSAVVLGVPLSLLTLLRVWDQASRSTLVAGASVGVIVEVVVLGTVVAIASV